MLLFARSIDVEREFQVGQSVRKGAGSLGNEVFRSVCQQAIEALARSVTEFVERHFGHHSCGIGRGKYVGKLLSCPGFRNRWPRLWLRSHSAWISDCAAPSVQRKAVGIRVRFRPL